MQARTLFTAFAIAAMLAACGGSAGSQRPSSGPTAQPTTRSTPNATPVDDVDRLDQFVRTTHAAPFVIHPEAEWTARLAEVRTRLASATGHDERFALVASLVGLLDTHTEQGPIRELHEYPIFLFHFTEGWYVIAALDPTLVGARLVSVDGHPVNEVEAALRPLVAHDNEMGFLLNAQQPFSTVEYLHGAGVISDPARPGYAFELPDGTQRTENFAALAEPAWEESLGLRSWLIGDQTEAVRRNGELTWSRVDADRRVLLIAVNDYGDDTAVIDAMHAALDAGTIDRVVLDLRFLPGGNGDFRLLDAIKAEPRVNRPGGLTVLIGRINFSVATAIVRDLDVNSQALLVGEPTPARADNFRCDCREITLSELGVTVSVPTWWDRLGDDRPEVAPDIRMDLSAADFFAGRDPVLDAALEGSPAPGS